MGFAKQTGGANLPAGYTVYGDCLTVLIVGWTDELSLPNTGRNLRAGGMMHGGLRQVKAIRKAVSLISFLLWC
jgi:hypothetical protein